MIRSHALKIGGVLIGAGLLAAAAYFAWQVRQRGAENQINSPNAPVRFDGFLRDRQGNARSLENLIGERAAVFCFLGIDCPLANRQVPHLIELERRFRAQGVRFLAVYSNESNTIDLAAAHAVDHKIPFTVLKDHRQALADALGVERTATVCLLDGRQVLRYRGRVDDRHGVAATRSQATQNNLADALDDLLADRLVRVPVTPSDGCLIERYRPPAASNVTYADDVEPILRQRCQSCHRPGQVAPFSLLTYDDAHRWSEMIREVVEERRMPPWHADERFGHFKNSRRLSQQEIDTLVTWVAGGLDLGNEAPPSVKSPWPSSWAIDKPDMVIEAPDEFDVPADGVVEYQYSYVPQEVTDRFIDHDLWVQAAEARPSDPAVVHHLTVFYSPPGTDSKAAVAQALPVLAAWAPGEPLFAYPEGTGLRLPKGTRLVFEVHYTPNGKATKDRPMVAIRLASSPPQRTVRVVNIDHQNLRIAKGTPDYEAETTAVFQANCQLLGLLPHMHLRGKAYRFDATYPDGRAETLLNVPRYDFNWQTLYWFDTPLTMPAGTRLHSVAHWDNSANNFSNPDPNANVTVGQQSTDEMMSGAAFFVTDEQDSALADSDCLKLDHDLLARDVVARWEGEVRQRPDDLSARCSLGAALTFAGRVDDAIRVYREVLLREPGRPEVLHALGALLAQNGQSDEAALLLQQAHEARPDDHRVASALATTLCDSGKVDQAIRILSKGLERKPNDANLLDALGSALLRNGNRAEAVRNFEAALDIDPVLPDARWHLGLALAESGNLAEAEVQFEQAVQIQPDSPDAHLYLGMCLAEKGQTSEALPEYRRALALNPRLTAAANNLAWLLATHSDEHIRNGNEAVTVAESALAAAGGNDAGLLDTLAAAYAEAGRFDDAVTAISRAINAAQESPTAGIDLDGMAKRKELYLLKQPYRDTKWSQ